VFVALGLTLFICAWLRWLEGNLHFVIIGGVVVLLATVLPYSYFVWRSDPDKAVGSSEDSASP
jgi:high-affinity Fe2+/Pb2+ permease